MENHCPLEGWKRRPTISLCRVSLIIVLATIFMPNLPNVQAFQALPYVHIDYEHYYRLAQCQAQCVEKYGIVAHKRRLDGSTRSYFNTTSQHYNFCQLGCQNARLTSGPTTKTRAVGDDAFKDGQQFWLNGAQSAPSKKSTISSTQTAERSPVASLRILCLKPASSAQANGFMDSYEALLSAQNHKLEFLAPVRYLLQWKQRIPLSTNKDQQPRYDETKWITASIESDSTFTAESLQPGVQYRFMVTVIGGSGRMGSGVSSDWIEAPLLGTPMPTVPLPLVVTPQFNSDDNVSAIISFRREATSNRRMSIASVCSYHLRYTNKTQDVYSQDFEMDESEGFLLTNLAFNTAYDIEIRPLSTLPSNTNLAIDNKVAVSIARFKTIACADVFGGGSLQCEPEPVQDLDIQLNEENSTVVLSWRASTEARHVLLYELRYVPLSDRTDCALDESTMYLPAKATRAELLIPGNAPCEVEVYLTNFDLRGREASITARFIYRPKESKSDNATFYGFESLSTNLWIVIAAPVLVIIALLVILRFAAVGQRRIKKKVAGLNGQNVEAAKMPLRQEEPPAVLV